jgi:tRNA G37 N-methylase Trm5
MQIIDNISNLLGDDLKNTTKKGDKLSIVASCFSIFAYESLKKELEGIEELKFMYPGKKFYYYRVFHDEYKFYYYFYMIFRYCEKCKLSDTSMELVKKYAYDSGE